MARPTEDPDLAISPARRHFAERMRHLRQELGWTQAQLAEAAGISQPHVSALERGTWEPRLETMVAIATALEVQLIELLPTIRLKKPLRKPH